MSTATVTRLPATDHERLVKLAGMLGSDHDGERASAALLASRLLKEHGMTWRDVLTSKPAPAPAPARWSYEPTRWHKTACHAVTLWDASGRDGLTDWERGFLSDLIDRPSTWRLSEKQHRHLERITVWLRHLCGL